jgi:2'-hydroxyisoflavone reductase
MRLVILGGSGFLGSELVRAAKRSGIDCTIVQRGVHAVADDIRASSEVIQADRTGGLAGVAVDWQLVDWIVDLSANSPDEISTIRRDASAFEGRYVFLSSTAVYKPPVRFGFTEDSTLVSTPEDRAVDPIGGLYAASKATCEFTSEVCFDNSLIVRPTYIIGPGDRAGRLHYWVSRMQAGRELLCPGPESLLFQTVDVRDVAEWIVLAIREKMSGVYQLAAPFPPVTFGDSLKMVAEITGFPQTRLTWVDEGFLRELRLEPNSLPLWPGWNGAGIIEAADPGKALFSGFSPRPFQQSVSEIVEECRQVRPEWTAGWSREREVAALGRWRVYNGNG